MITVETLEKWRLVPTETERLEFKEAKHQNQTYPLRSLPPFLGLKVF